MPFAAGSAIVPTLTPDQPAEVTVELDRKMPNDKFDVSLLRNAPLLGANAEVSVLSKTPTSVTLRVMVKQGLAGAGAVFVICN